MRILALLLVAWCQLAATPVMAERSFLLVITGLGGDEEHRQRFHHWSVRLLQAAEEFGIADADTIFLSEDPERDPERIDGPSSKAEIERRLGELAAAAGSEDSVWIVIIGHGGVSGPVGRLNLPGPDMTASDFASALKSFRADVAFVNTASASGGFVGKLSAPGRAVVTATKSRGQNHETVFGDYFTQAFEGAKADLDKNGRISLLEAFDFARLQVSKHYESKDLLATENALLDDNGDGEGSLEPAELAAAAGQDGDWARELFFGAFAAGSTAPGSPAIAELERDKRALERRIRELRRQKASLPEELYLDELEKLLIELALKERALTEAGEAGLSTEDPSLGGRVDDL